MGSTQGAVWGHCRSLNIYLIWWKLCFKEADVVMVDLGCNQAKKSNLGMVSRGLIKMVPPCEEEKGERRNAYEGAKRAW